MYHKQKQSSYNGKPSPDRPDGVSRRHPDTTAERSNPRTPTLILRSGVLTIINYMLVLFVIYMFHLIVIHL